MSSPLVILNGAPRKVKPHDNDRRAVKNPREYSALIADCCSAKDLSALIEGFEGRLENDKPSAGGAPTTQPRVERSGTLGNESKMQMSPGGAARAPESAKGQRGVSPLQGYALRPETERNCVTVR